jgi:hypothetical protein
MNNGTFITHDFGFVPFTERFGVLRFCRDHVVQRCGHPVTSFPNLASDGSRCPKFDIPEKICKKADLLLLESR